MALTDTAIKNAKPRDKAYKMTDGGGLYLLVQPSGSRLWYYRYRFGGKETRISLGAYPNITLAKAREAHAQARALLASGVNPSAQRAEDELNPKSNTFFETVALKWHENNTSWGDYSASRILRAIQTYLFPVIGKKDIKELKTRDLLVPLRLASEKGYLETASRLRQHIGGIMRYAVQSGYIDYNPAADLSGAIPTPKTTHYPSLDLTQLPELLNRLEQSKGRKLTLLATKLALTLFVRSSELRFATWEEIDFEGAMWTIPAERTPIEGVRYSQRGAKMRTPHLVPLSRQSIELLEQVKSITGNGNLIFSGDHDKNKPMSENTINTMLRRIGYDTKTEICGHGFRAMACCALIESGLWSEDAVERQMSHQERNNVRAAYTHKAKYLGERFLMMQWWSDYIDVNKEKYIAPYDFSHDNKAENVLKFATGV